MTRSQPSLTLSCRAFRIERSRERSGRKSVAFARQELPATGADEVVDRLAQHKAPSGDSIGAFAAAMNPRVLVPIHGVAWDAAAGVGNVVRLGDGEEMAIGMSSG